MLNRCFLSWRDEDDDDVTGENRAEKHDFQSRVTDDSDGPEIRGMLGEVGGHKHRRHACRLAATPGLAFRERRICRRVLRPAPVARPGVRSGDYPTAMNSAVFPMIPAAGKSLWFFAVIGLVPLAVLVVLIWLAWSMQGARFTVSPEGLRLQGDLYGRLIPFHALKLDEAVVTDLNTDRDHQPTRRTMGTGLPGYSAGWFRLRNGAKALLYVTDRTRVARIPTTEGYTVMLSVDDPAAFIAEIRARSRAL